MPPINIVRRWFLRLFADRRGVRSESGGRGISDGASYRHLLRTPSLRALLTSVSLMRFGGGLMQLTLILYTLDEWGSSGLVGLVVLFSWVPGIAMSPVAGVLMDARRRAQFVVLDCCVAAIAAIAIAVLALTDLLEPWLLLAIVGISSLTLPFGDTGRRTLLGVVPHHHHWDRTNAMESALSSIVSTVAPAVAGLLVGLGASELSFAVSGVFLLSAAVVLLRVREPDPTGVHRSKFRHRLNELHRAWRTRTVRGLSTTVFVDNAAIGILEVAVPVWILDRFGLTGLLVGLLWSAFNLSSFGVTLALGRVGTVGREPRIIMLALGVQVTGFLMLLFSGAPWWAIVCMAIAGTSIGPIDVSMFSMLQREVPPGRLAQSNAVALTITSLGIPIGAFIGGLVAASSPTAALALAPLVAAAAAVAGRVLLRRGPKAAESLGLGASIAGDEV